MKFNPEGMELFKELCNGLKTLNLFTEDVKVLNGSGMEVVSFFYNEEIRQRVTDPGVELPVATVQYITENQRISQNEVMGVSLKFYQTPLLAVGLAPILENYKRYRTELQDSQESPYYNYIFVDPYTRDHVYEYINALFTSLYKETNSIAGHLSLVDTQSREPVLV